MTTDTLSVARRIARKHPEMYDPATPGSYDALRAAALAVVTEANRSPRCPDCGCDLTADGRCLVLP
jgi:hypothetical protein